jgi:hypothetical protein
MSLSFLRDEDEKRKLVDFVVWVSQHPEYAEMSYIVGQYCTHLACTKMGVKPTRVWDVAEHVLIQHLGCKNREEVVRKIVHRLLLVKS